MTRNPHHLLLAAALLVTACGSQRAEIKPHQPERPLAVTPADLATGAPLTAAPSREGDPASLEATLPAGEDITARLRAQQSAAFARPPTQFRAGHTTPRRLPAGAVTTSASGFSVTLPSGAPITTPAVYDGRVYVSGGFRSKELYAFDAHTGRLAWALNLDDDGPSAPACAEGVCAFNTESCTLFVVDAKTGAQRWSLWLGDPLTSAPTIASGRVFSSYPVGANGPVHGALMNQINSAATEPTPIPSSSSSSSSTLAPQAPLAPTPPSTRATGTDKTRPRPPGATHALAAFDLKTGAVRWQVWLDSDVMSAPVAVGDYLYATTFAGTFLKLRQDTGEVVAAREVRATPAPVVSASGDIFFTQRAEGEGEVAAEAIVRSNPEGRAQWSRGKKRAGYLDRGVQSSSALALQAAKNDSANGFSGGAPSAANPSAALDNIGQGSVFSMQAFQGSRLLHTRSGNFNAMGDELLCTDPRTGERRWALELEGDLAKAGGFLAAPPAEAGGSVFLSTLKGQVLQIDPQTGRIQHRWELGHPIRSQPVIEGGWIYIGTDDGRLIGVDTGDRALTGWSQWGANAARTGTSEG